MDEIEILPAQDEFIFSDKKFVCFDGGWGNGKSTAGFLKLALHCYKYPGTKVGLFRQDKVDLRRSTLTEWRDLYDDYGYFHSDDSTFYFDNGSEVLFHQLSDLHKLNNHNLSAGLIEQAEETTPEAFWTLFGRMRRTDADHRWLGVLSNPEGHDWIWKLFYQKEIPAPDNQAKQEMEENDIPPPSPDDFHLIAADTYSNKENLPDDFLASLATLPEERYKKYVLGSRDVQRGAIYPMLKEGVQFIDPFPIPQEWPKYFTFDHGSQNPSAGLWITQDYEGRMYVYREHYAEPSEANSWLVKDHAEYIKKKERDRDDKLCPYQENVPTRTIDPACSSKTQEKGNQKLSVIELFSRHGIHFYPWKRASNPKDKQAQINRVGEYFMPQPEFEHPVTKESPAPKLYIFRNCPNTWEEHTQYKWQERSTRRTHDKNKPDKPRKYMDHSCDALMGMMASRYAPPKEKKLAPKGSFLYTRNKMIAKKRDDGGEFTFNPV